MNETTDSTAIHCPSCGVLLYVDAGNRVECPGCGQPIQVETATPQALAIPPTMQLPPGARGNGGNPNAHPADGPNYQPFAIIMVILIGLFGVLGAASTGIGNAGMLAAVGLGYCLPLLVAAGMNHRQTSSITVLNLALGWTVVFWIAALIWAASGTGRRNA